VPRIATRIAAAVAGVSLTLPATAACHHYRVWRYPQPQRCGAPSEFSVRPAPEDHSWYVEIIVDERAEAIAKLKTLLNGEVHERR
jgi:hypothetical protein